MWKEMFTEQNGLTLKLNIQTYENAITQNEFWRKM